MPYRIGAKGSNDCSGFPVVSVDGKVMGCHDTRSQAAAQIYAINRSEGKIGKSMVKEGDMVMAPHEEEMYVGRVVHVMNEGMLGIPGSEYAIEASPTEPAILIQLFEMEEGGLEETEYFVGAKASEVMVMPSLEENVGMDKAYEGCGCPTCKEMNVDCENCPVCSKDMAEKGMCCSDNVEKQAPCWDGYVQRGMKPGADGKMVPNCVPAQKAEDYWEDDDTVVYDEHEITKADGYVPPAGARAAARKAIKFKEQGKANGAGTSVGWTRAGQLARGETLSLSTVKRMYSYFSRHEVDKKGKDWGNQSNPSNGYIMWLAWGGDAGFSWSRKIVNKETDKMLFSNFGREVEKVEQIKHTVKRDYSTSSRERMAESGSAMSDGSFPIANATDLRNAIQSVGRAKDYDAAKQHIIRRARALGLVDMLPEDWKKGVRKTNWGGSIFDLNPFVK
jgi:hypothetical protein